VVAAQGTGGAETVMPVPESPPLWAADMETGNLLQWEDNIYQAAPCGGQFNSGDGLTVPSQDYAHTGLWSAKMTMTGNDPSPTTNGTRMFRWCEPTRYRELFYSVWYYLPQQLTVASGGWLNVFSFKGGGAGPDPFFMLDLRNAPGTGAMTLALSWWGGLTIEGPSPGQSGYRAWTTTQTVPSGRWFQVEVRQVCDGNFGGAIQVWQDGVELFNLSGVRTRYPDTWVPKGECAWGVNNYGTGITPSPVVLYIDDAVISQSRIGP
jgi:hypothetical protein